MVILPLLVHLRIIDNKWNPWYYYRMPITNSDSINRNFFLGFIRLHILHHGYTLSPGTLYPILHALERDGFLQAEKQIVGGKIRKYYTATDKGQEALSEALVKVRELMEEIDTESKS